MKLLIKNGQVINPSTNLNDTLDVLIEGNKILQIGKNINSEVTEIIDATDCMVVPGLIDIHVHLRDPGYEHKETIETGSNSAAKGGFTTICPMPNTHPITDSEEVVAYIKDKAKKEAVVNVLPIGAITKGQLGKELAHFEGLKDAGICAVSEDGKSVRDSNLLKMAMEKTKALNLPMLSHCEDDYLAEGCMNEGKVSKRLGLKGIPNVAEDIIAARDILLSEAVNTKLHLCHVSTKESIQLVREAKARGAKVTCEVCPHHFTLTEEVVTGDNPNTKMNPPLRTKKDVEAILEGFKEGIVDVIATDHAPHSAEEKQKGYAEAPNGIVGLETAVSLTITHLLNKGYITEDRMVELLSVNPAKVLGIDKGDISKGKIADITIINPDEKYTVDINEFASKSNNSPFDKMVVSGRVKFTIVNGEIVYKAR